MNRGQAQVLYPQFGSKGKQPTSHARAIFEDCDRAPARMTERRAQGILVIHLERKCTPDTCVRLRAAQQYLATPPNQSNIQGT